MPYITRRKESELQWLLEHPASETGAILIEGARQVGKTTMVQQVLASLELPVHAVDLEERALLRSQIDACREFREFEDLLRDELGFDPTAESVLFMDEAQESSALGRFVRYMKERWRQTRVILTGSTLTRLFREDTRFPVGRVTRLRLRPFSFPEFLHASGQAHLAEAVDLEGTSLTKTRHRTLLEHLDRYLQVGGLPLVVLDHVAGRNDRQRRAEILADYEQDFIRLFGENTIAIVMGCLRSVANFVGSPSKNSSVIPSPTNRINEEIKRVFGRLESWGLILRADQRSISPEASHRHLPKRYLFDTGLLRHMRELAVPSIRILDTLDAQLRRPLGGILENQLAIELMEQAGALAGWKKTPAGLEIDFVVDIDGHPIPVECKATTVLKKTLLKGVRGYLDLYGIQTGAVVSLAPFDIVQTAEGTRVVNIPLYLADRMVELLRESL